MARKTNHKSSVDRLPVEIKIELKRKLRSSQYILKEIENWLNELGFKISKSSLGRYSKRLRDEDISAGIDREIMSIQTADVVALFEELSHIKVREQEILCKLKLLLIK